MFTLKTIQPVKLHFIFEFSKYYRAILKKTGQNMQNMRICSCINIEKAESLRFFHIVSVVQLYYSVIPNS